MISNSIRCPVCGASVYVMCSARASLDALSARGPLAAPCAPSPCPRPDGVWCVDDEVTIIRPADGPAKGSTTDVGAMVPLRE